MKRKPKPERRCKQCGGVRRPSDDYTPAERASPLCWVCRLAVTGELPVPELVEGELVEGRQQNGAKP